MKKISKNNRGFTRQNFLKKNSGGFMQIVILAIVVIATLAYFNIDLRTIFNRPEVQKVWNIVVIAWTIYIKPMLTYLWTNIGLPNIPTTPTVPTN